jgi:hypothetical protein
MLGAMPPNPENTGLKTGNRFRPGVSGNPSGRPKGARNKTTEFAADLLHGDAEAIMSKVVTMAKDGHPMALKLCIERMMPVRTSKDRSVEFDVGQIGKVQDLAACAAEIFRGATAGELSLGEASEMMKLVEAHRRVIETTELAVRLEVLEKAAGLAGDQTLDPDLSARIRKLDDGAVRK